MKLKNKIALAAVAIGVFAGISLSLLLHGAHWGVYVGFGFLTTLGANQGIGEALLRNKKINNLEERST